jgi:hypothetical protein
MKHTKGPWHICEVTGRYFRYIRDEKGFCVAEAIKPQNSSASYIDIDANAQLISAAPDLLAALIELQQMVEAGESNEGTYEIVRNAIAKARGV